MDDHTMDKMTAPERRDNEEPSTNSPPSTDSQQMEKHEQEETFAPEHIHIKTIILLITTVAIYWVQVIHATGVGTLANLITAQLGGANKATWLTETIAIVAAALSVPVSQGADLWGRKWFVVFFTTCGFVGSLIVSRADGFTQLIIGQTIGAFHAGCQTLLHAIASEIMPRKYRPYAQAATATAGGLGGLTGALLSGGITKDDPTHWRRFFYILAALYGAAGIVFALLYNPPPRELQLKLTQRQKLKSLDWIGYLLLIPGMVLFGFALTSSSGVYHWKSGKVIGPLVVGSISLILFVLYEWLVKKDGMLHHDLFRNGRNFPIAFGAFFVEGIIFYSTNVYYAYEAVAIFGRTLFLAGAFYGVGWSVEIVSTLITGFYCSRTKTVKLPLMIAFSSFVIFCSLMAALKTDERANQIGYVAFFGVAVGISLNCLVTLAQLSTPKEHISVTTGLVIGVRSFGGTIGLSIYHAIFETKLTNDIPSEVSKAVAPFNFHMSELGELIGAIASENATLLESIPGVTPALIEAAEGGYREGTLHGFRYVWVAAAAFCGVALFACTFIRDPKQEFTPQIDAPLETPEQLHGESMKEQITHRRTHA